MNAAAVKNQGPGRAISSKGVVRYGIGATAIGYVFLALTDRGIRALALFDEPDYALGLARLQREMPGGEFIEDAAAISPALRRISSYLAGEDDCEDMKIDLLGGTRFQRRVWEAIRSIPRGDTKTYGGIALELGTPGAARAVGAACGANPVSLLIPCHRVVGSGGSLGGYYWGLERKQELLDLERMIL